MKRASASDDGGAVPVSRELAALLGPMCFVAVVVAVSLRIFEGVDFSDDAYYAALPWSFGLGHAPFVDEWAIHQLSALLTWPLFAAYLDLSGSNDGLILFQRLLHVAVSVAAALTVRSTLATLFGPRIAWPVSALVVAYVPFHIQALSYNTIASLALATGLFVLAGGVARATEREKNRVTFAAATVLLSIASFAYPPVFPAALCALAGALWATLELAGRDACLQASIPVSSVSLACVAIAAGLVWMLGGFSHYTDLATLDASLAAQGGGLRKLGEIAREFSTESKFVSGLLVWLGGVLWVSAGPGPPRTRTAIALMLALFPVALRPLYVPMTEPFTVSPFLWSTLALASPLLVYRVDAERPRPRLLPLLVIVGPSLVAGSSFLWASANGLRNTSLGLLPATIVGLACVASLMSRQIATGPMRSLAATGLIISLLGFQVFELWQTTYRNGPVSGLTAEVTAGPWRGIHTTPERKRLLERLAADLERHASGASTIFVYDYFPAGYLLSDLQPMTHTLWTFPGHCCQGTPAAREVYARRFAQPADRPDLVLENRCLFIEDQVQRFARPADRPPDPVAARLFEAPYRIVARHPCYTLHRLQRQ